MGVGGVAEPDVARAPRRAGDRGEPGLGQQYGGVGKRARSSPISARSTPVRTGPTPGKLAKIGVSGRLATAAAMASS
jgi:hypothetical protein